MTERPTTDGRDEKRDSESLADVRDRLSTFLKGEGEKEGRSDEPADGSTAADADEPDAGGTVTDNEAGESEGSEEPEETGGKDVIVEAAVRERVGEMAVASEFYEALNEAVNERLSDAARRAEANGRKTVQARDL